MRPADDRSCYSYGAPQDNNPTANSTFEFHKGNMNMAAKSSQNRSKALGSRPKPTPSKWDDAQKWLVGLSGGGGQRGVSKNKPRNSNADDRRLLGSASQRERHSCSSAEGLSVEEIGMTLTFQDEGETKKIDNGEGLWRINKPMEDCPLAVRPVCVRDMGTEMTPIASQEPSRTATPLRAGTPVMRSPISSRSSTPGRRCQQGPPVAENWQRGQVDLERKREAVVLSKANCGGDMPKIGDGEASGGKNVEISVSGRVKEMTSLESRAMAWDEAERAKYMARYKREEVKIQAWENHEKRKAETEMRKMEMKAERLKAWAQERLTNKLAATRRGAEEKHANAEAKLKEQAARTSERADYIRRTGHLPSSFFFFKLPSLCRRKLRKIWSRKLRIC